MLAINVCKAVCRPAVCAEVKLDAVRVPSALILNPWANPAASFGKFVTTQEIHPLMFDTTVLISADKVPA